MLRSLLVSDKFICKAPYHTILLIDTNGFPPLHKCGPIKTGEHLY